MKIHILPPHLRQQIAAGEIIERPASVVKELIENALDAGAQHISVDVEHAGRQLIRVTDDGAGMEPEDVPLAFERFATSKIHVPRDIESVRTFGFRGEALPSIAAVSRVELQTRLHGAALGTSICLEGGILRSIGESGTAVGTRVAVRDLFFNTPARRKFLRSLRTELSHILGVFTTFTLAFPELGWALSCDGRPLFELTASNYRERILGLYGQEVAAQLESFDGEGLSGRVWGSVRRDHGGRPTRVPPLRESPLRPQRQPVPRRTCRPRGDRDAAAVRRNRSGVGGCQCASSQARGALSRRGRSLRSRAQRADTSHRSRQSPADGRRRGRGAYTPSGSAGESGTFQTVGQVDNTFIVASAHGHLYVIDQHAAHERVLYDQLLEAMARHVPPRRSLMSPQVLVLASRELQTFEDHRQELEACGFVFDQFGPGAVAIRAIPEVSSAGQAESLCRRLVQRLRDNAGGAAQRNAAADGGLPGGREGRYAIIPDSATTAAMRLGKVRPTPCLRS